MTVTIAPRPQPAPPRPYRFPRFERRVLENGLALLVAPLHELPIVSVTLVVDAGAMTEPEGQDGVAGLAAQALLEGTAQRRATELTARLEGLGAAVAAGADWDTATIGVTVLRPRLADAMALLAEIVMTPTFPEREVGRLKSERLAEIMQLRAEPRGLADETFARVLYAPVARYARPERGSAEAVASLGRGDVERLYAARYHPAGSTVILAGDITPDDAASIVAGALGGWRGTATGRRQVADTPARSTREVHLVDRPDAPQSEIRVGHPGLPRSHPDYFGVLVMNALLGGLFSSRINLNLRERHAYTYGAFSAFDWRRAAGPFVVSTAVQSDVTAAAAREILAEIDAIRAEPVTADELELATSYLAGVFPIKYETTEAVARALAAMVVFALPADYFDRYRDRVRAVTREDVLAAAREHLHPDRLQLVIVGAESVVRAPLESLGVAPITAYEPNGTGRAG